MVLYAYIMHSIRCCSLVAPLAKLPTRLMTDLLCPFSATLIKQDFGCEYAQEIIRRGGAEIACELSQAHDSCRALHQNMKAAALVEMGVEDDLLTLPHSVLVKIQFGGLLGLQQAVEPGTEDVSRVVNITALVSAAIEHFVQLDNIPYEKTTQTIIDYKLSRRRERK